MQKYGSLTIRVPSPESNLKIQKVENGVVEFGGSYNNNQWKEVFDLTIANDCLQFNQSSIYFINCLRENDNSIDTKTIHQFIFSDGATAEEIFNLLNRLKSKEADNHTSVKSDRIINEIAYMPVKVSARFEGKPAIEDSITFRSNNDGKLYTFKTDKKGSIIAKLPLGNEYSVFLPGYCDELDSTIRGIDLTNETFSDNTILQFEALNFYGGNYGISFEKNKNVLQTESISQLKEIVDVYLNTKNNYSFIIKYSSKNQKPGSKSLELSLKRAKIVMNYLIQSGISKESINIKPLGVKEEWMAFDDSVTLFKIIYK